MSKNLIRYSTYRPSNVPWLEELPVMWDFQRGKWIFMNRKEINVNNKCTNILSLTLRGVVNNNPNNPEGLVPKDYSTYQIFRKNDLVFKLIDLENFQTSRVGLVHEDGIMSPAYVRLIKKHDGNQKYFYYFYYSLYQQGIFNELGEGVRSTLNSTDLLNIRVPIPTIGEQQAIVKYLDYVDKRVKKYIRAKQKQIKLLEEMKRAIIHQAVTRGLNPSASLRPSGVEWIGDIPEYWRPRKLWTVGKVRNEKNPGELPLLSVFLHVGVTLHEGSSGQTHAPSLNLNNYQVVRKGDLVLNNQQAWRGSVGVSSFDGIISPAYIVIRLASILDPIFSDYLFQDRVMVDQFVISSKGVGDIQRQIYWPYLRNIFLPIPPLNEQRKIADYLDGEIAKINARINLVTKKLNLSREFMARLITDVITGKLDVRQAASQLPDEVEELLEETDESLEEDFENGEEMEEDIPEEE